MRNILIILLLSATSFLSAAVSGSSEGTVPGPVVHENYLTVQNDNWPAGGADDNRTASADMGIQLWGNLRLGLTYDMFTQKDRNFDWFTSSVTHNYVTTTTTTTVTTGHGKGPKPFGPDHDNGNHNGNEHHEGGGHDNGNHNGWGHGNHVHTTTTTTTSTVDNAETTYAHGSTDYVDRVDALSLTADYRMWDMLTLGAGIRITGNLRGEEVQNRWHRIIGDDTIYNLKYPETEIQPLFVADLRNYVVNEDGANFYWSASLASCNRSMEQEYGLGIWNGVDADNLAAGVAWLGLNVTEYAGHTQDYVIDRSWENEEGFGVEAGLTLGNALFRVVWRQEGHVQGEFGIVF